ncbi:MAG: outer membrane protein assembly factor BamA [Janthinobacterium lividum]
MFTSHVSHAAETPINATFVIGDIRIAGLHHVDASTIYAYLPLKKGATFTPDAGSAALRALYATGFFNDVRIDAEGSTVIVTVKERPTVTNVDFSGTREFDKDTLSKALRASGLAPGRYFDQALAAKAEQELKRQYLTRGYYAAEVSTTITPVDNGRVAILFTVIEGPSAKIRQVNFTGNRAFSNATLREEMQMSTPNWFSWYTKNDQYSRDKLNTDLEHIRAYYLDHGYLEFSIESTQVSISPDKRDMYLTLGVHEGEPYTVSSIQLSGELLNKEKELGKLLQLKAGERFSASKLQDSTKAIVDKLGEYGYAFANVNAQPQINQANHTVALDLKVETGRRVYVRHVNITGNAKTRDEVVRREMRQFESSWFDSKRLKLSQDRVNRLGYFTDVNVTTQPIEGNKDEVDINVDVKEKPTGAITLGAGFSSSDKIVLSAGITQDNVFGSGTSLALNVNTSSYYRTLALTQTDPYFTIDGISRISEVYYKTSYPLYSFSDTSFRIVTLGTSLKFGIPFSEYDTVYFGAGIEQDRLHIDSSTPAAYKNYVKEFGDVVNNVPVTAAWSRDNRDSALIPSRGYYARANTELGTPAGTTQYYKGDLQFQYYTSFARGYILGLNLQGGYGHGINGMTYPIFKNYYGGGIGSVRGYESGSLGPRDGSTGDPIGGSKMAVANAELTVPLPGTGYDRTLRVFTFFDAGNVWGDSSSSIGTNGLRYGYGAGLEWISPIGPLKLDLGFPVVRHAGDKYEKFQFQIGTSF